MEFIAEIKKTTQRKTSSLDNIYEIVLSTDNPTIMDLGKLPPDNTFKITIEMNNG